MCGRVLLVEDDEAIRGLLEATLVGEGYEVDVAGCAGEVWQRVESRAPDLVLLDLALPGEDGLTICSKLRQRPAMAQVPVLFVSAMTSPMYVQAAAQVGGNGFIKKPFDIEKLIATVSDYLIGAAIPEAPVPK